MVTRSPDGLAVAHHPGVRPEDFQAERVDITASLEGHPSKSAVTVPWERLKEGPITLTLPPTGRVIVKLLDPEAKPATGRVDLTIRGSVRVGKAERRVMLRSRTESGTAEVRFVPAGMALFVTARAEGFDSVLEQPIGEIGSEGEDLVAHVTFASRKAVVVGRAVDEGGNLLRGRDLDVQVAAKSGVAFFASPLRASTDADGAFRIPLDRNLWPNEPSLDLELEMSSAPQVVERSGIVPLARLSPAPETQVGDVRLVPPPALASGAVLDDLGEPVEGALVTTESTKLAPRRGATVVRGAGFPSDSRLKGRTDANGAFVISLPPRSRDRIQSFRLKAELEGWSCPNPTVQLLPGITGVTVLLLATGAIEGSLQLPDPSRFRKVEFLITRNDAVAATAPKKQRLDDRLDSDGRFRLPGIVPGTVTLSIRLPGVAEPLLSIPDVVVPRLGVSDDPRLRGIDLREHPLLR
jgi:hypothetical protein